MLRSAKTTNPEDSHRLRPNVGGIIVNDAGKVLLAKRIDLPNAWQFPQGGIQSGETPRQAIVREMNEELGITTRSYQILHESTNWHSYYFPVDHHDSSHDSNCFVGQSQKWFLLNWRGCDSDISLSGAGSQQEFSQWEWVNYWYPLHLVVHFKRAVYQKVLIEMRHHLPNQSLKYQLHNPRP